MKLNSKITYRKIDDAFIIITPWDNAMHSIEIDVSKDIFSLIIENYTKEEIIREITSIYDIEEDIAKKDIDEFIKDLMDKKIIL